MQTFILNHELHISAQWLDTRRLNKQLTECHQIINIIQLNQKAWSNHPCVLQWKNNIPYLFTYTQCIAYECNERRINHKHIPYYLNAGLYSKPFKPNWITDEFINRHRQALLFKTALKYAVYSYSFKYDKSICTINDGMLHYRFGIFLKENKDKFKLDKNNVLIHYPMNKPFYQSKQKATYQMMDSARIDYEKYLFNFGNLDHKLDYLWGEN